MRRRRGRRRGGRGKGGRGRGKGGDEESDTFVGGVNSPGTTVGSAGDRRPFGYADGVWIRRQEEGCGGSGSGSGSLPPRDPATADPADPATYDPRTAAGRAGTAIVVDLEVGGEAEGMLREGFRRRREWEGGKGGKGKGAGGGSEQQQQHGPPRAPHQRVESGAHHDHRRALHRWRRRWQLHAPPAASNIPAYDGSKRLRWRLSAK